MIQSIVRMYACMYVIRTSATDPMTFDNFFLRSLKRNVFI